MTDLLHLLMDTIKVAWRGEKVASTLFLNVEGVFPNEVTDWLVHNLKKHSVPGVYIEFVRNMLTGRKTKLKFNNYTSHWFNLDNGIGQGDPLSMLLYLYYNADLLDVAGGQQELALGYMDDVALVAVTKLFSQTCYAGEHVGEEGWWV